MGLEDALGDVVGKAMRGNKVTADELARKVGIPASSVEDMLNYQHTPSDGELDKIADVLGLNSKGVKLVAHEAYEPESAGLDDWGTIAVLSSPYEDYYVNTFIIWDADSKNAVLFDTGTDFEAIKKVVDDNGLTIQLLAITHTHGDHIEVLDEVISAFSPEIIGSEREPVEGAKSVQDGDTCQVGSLQIEARETDGHSPGGLTFVVKGPKGAPLAAVVGDAIFAGSAGGAMISYENLHRNIRTKILTLPDDTLLLPGHGPVTTVGQEKVNNPFAPTNN